MAIRQWRYRSGLRPSGPPPTGRRRRGAAIRARDGRRRGSHLSKGWEEEGRLEKKRGLGERRD
jgi:hypothetical protein